MEPVVAPRPPLRRRLAWSVPWLVFQVFPVLDLVLTPRPAPLRALVAVALVAFTVAYMSVLARFNDARGVRPDFLVVVALEGAFEQAEESVGVFGVVLFHHVQVRVYEDGP